MGYFTPRWLVVYGYLLIALIATPYLPLLIKWASSRWPAGSIPIFVLGVEISIGILLVVSAGVIFFYNRRKFPSFILIVGGLIAFASLFYLIVPNPYELTHLPEYAILSVLIMRALGGKGSGLCSISAGQPSNLGSKFSRFTIPSFHHTTVLHPETSGAKALYFQSALITGVLGAIDELYQGALPVRSFTWYDIFLNGLGGILGLTFVWGISHE